MLPQLEKPTVNLNYSLFHLAYEQAFELATNESQRSHVRAAMGMLGYISGDKDGCKLALYER